MAKKTNNTPQKASGKNIVINQISLQTIRRQTQEIGKWRQAILSADSLFNPNRTTLYDLLEDITLDGHLTSVLQKRRDAAKNVPLIFTRNGEEDEDLAAVLSSPDMFNLIEDLIDTMFYGYTLIQINNIYFEEEEEVYRIDYDLIPRKHVHPEDGFECVSKYQGSSNRDYTYKKPPLSKYMIWAGKSKDYGLLTKAAQYVIYKRGGFGDWAEYAELFGRPFREGRYDSFDDATRIELEKVMSEYGGSGWAILPKNADFTIHEASGASGSNTLYETFIKACNEEISKIIVGQTMTTDNGSSRSQGEVHLEEENEIKSADKLFITLILNSKFKSILKRFGFNVAGGNIRYKQSVDLDELLKKVNIMSRIKHMVPVDDDYIYEELGVPKPKNYDALKKETQENRVLQKQVDDPVDDKKTKNLLHRFFV